MAKEDIWEESDLIIKAQVTGEPTKPYTGTVDLIYVKNGAEDKPLATEADLAIADGKLEHKFKTPKVLPEEATYSLTVIAKYGKSKETRSDVADAVVWPKTVSIHTRTDKNPNEKKVPLAVVQKGVEGAKPVTGDDGKAEAELTEKVPYTLKSLSPYSIIKDETDPKKLRVHELTVERNIVAQFISPDVAKPPYVENETGKPEPGYRQFVNEPTALAGVDAMGNEVTFTVAANPKDSGRKDDPIYIQVTFGRESERNKPKAELLNSPAVTDLKNAPDVNVYTGYVKLDADAGTAKFKVNLGIAGGDTCTVAIGGRKDTYTDASLILVNWRKLYYELRYPALLTPKLSAAKDYEDTLKANVTARLGKAFIVFEMFKTHEFPDADATIAKKNGTIIPAAYMKDATGGNRYLLTNGILDTTGKFSGDAAKKKRTVYVSLCQRAFSSNNKAHTIAPKVESDDFDIASPENYLFEPSTKDGGANLKVGAYEWKAVITGAQTHATKLAFEATDNTAAVAGVVKVVETRRAGKTLDVAFGVKGAGHETALAATEKTRIETFVAGLLTDLPALRQAGNQVTIKMVAQDSDADATARSAAVRAAIQAKFNATPSNVKYHPGLDKDGAVRKGAMNLVWLTFKDYETINVKLPKSPAATPDHQKTMPGDFAGPAETDAQCQVQVKFDLFTTGEINGNSGSGEQLMVLRVATAGAISSTICHELGHGMGMTVVPGLNNDLAPPGITIKHIDNGGTSYVNGDAPYAYNDGKRNLHKGDHCATSVPAAKIANATFDGWDPTTATTGCIMWGSGGNDDTRPDYCPTCLAIIQARRLDDIRAAFAGRGADNG